MHITKYLIQSKVFLIVIFFWGCKPNELDTHLLKLNEINEQIGINGWEIRQKLVYQPDDIYFALEKKEIDTTFSLSFTVIKADGQFFYTINEYIKSYFINDIYYEMALFNRDTLYFYKNKNLPSGKKETQLFKMNFITGKYYYMYKHGYLNSGQKEYFENNKDSLIKIRGNNLIELLDLRLEDEKKDTSFSLEDLETDPHPHINK